MQVEKKVKPTPEHFLDFVLGLMVNWEIEHLDLLTPAEISNTIERCKYDNTPEYFRANKRFLFQILNKLTKDGYIEFLNKEVSFKDREYFITVEGGMLNRNNGYKAIAATERRKRILQNCKDYLLIIGSWLAGIGTIVLAIIEIIKYAHKT